MKRLTKKDLPKAVRKTLWSKVKLTDIRKVGNIYRLEGNNFAGKKFGQHFIQYVSPRGRTIGSVMKEKGERFWSIWKNENVLTKNVGAGKVALIGSESKTAALRMLHQRIGLSNKRLNRKKRASEVPEPPIWYDARRQQKMARRR